MISKIRIQNLKSIVDSGDVEIKPLTVLIGKNSSGKSSFLRVFPLFKQSFGLNVSDPILWYGPFVDFGSFRNALCSDRPTNEDAITFSFVLDANRDYRSLSRPKESVHVSLEIHDKDIRKISYKLGKNLFCFLKQNGRYTLKVNDFDFNAFDFNISNHSGRKFPIGVGRGEGNVYYGAYPALKFPSFIAQNFDLYGDILPNMHRMDLISSSQLITQDYLRAVALKMLQPRGEGETNKKTTTEEKIKEMADYILLNYINMISVMIESSLSSSFSDILYFQPLRAKGDRFYRVQGLRTSQIDSDGENGPMFLYNLSDSDRVKFETWCLDTFGFAYSVPKTMEDYENTSVIVRTKNGKNPHNMTDVGFGYSQIFPIVLSLWNSIRKGRRGESKEVFNTFVIEQPELHLHPAFQKKIMDAIFKIIELSNKTNVKTQFILETHSETIVNYLGRKIGEGYDANKVNLLFCSKTEGQGTCFEEMRFDEQGIIRNWPLGFFSDED